MICRKCVKEKKLDSSYLKHISKEGIKDILNEITQAFRSKIEFWESQIKIVDEIVVLKKYENDNLIKLL